MTTAVTRVLLIEDDEDDYLLTRDLLSQGFKAHHQLEWIADFNQARTAIGRGSHDVCLIDYRLGAWSGLDLVRHAIVDGCTAPFIMMSGQGNEALAVEAIKSECEDYVVKGRLTPEGMVRTVRNAIERVALRHEIRRKQKALNEAQDQQLRLKDQFLSHVSHELCTPLSVVHQFLSIVLDGIAGGLNEQQREYLSIAFANAEQLKKMIGDLMEGARSLTGQLRVEAQPVVLDVILREAVSAFQGTAGAKAVSLRARLLEDLPQALADATRIRQVLNNLIENAIKFTPREGQVVVEARLDPDKPDHVRVSVADTGCGISEKGLGRVFDRLYQEKNASAESRRGLGLGLYICKELITRQNGEIRAESVLGQGSTFHFTLPAIAPG